MARIIDFDKIKRGRQGKIEAQLAREAKIIQWSSEMYRAGHMPEDVARVFQEYFGGQDSDGNPI